MNILGIETSCDDTGVALVHATDQGFDILSEKTASQIDIHKKYGGVVPEVAGRAHAENILPVVEAVMEHQEKPDVIAVTSGPGLITGLLVGVETAKTLSYLWGIPLIGVNHIEGHIHSVLLTSDVRRQTAVDGCQTTNARQRTVESQSSIEFPALALIVSGGHTELILMRDFGDYQLVGKTRDDAVGECFDKVAKLLELEYPGGPKISKRASEGNPHAIAFPRPMLDSNDYDFSFSGLKTAALYWLRDNALSPTHTNPFHTLPAGVFGTQSESPTIHDFCASFQQAIVDVLIEKTMNAARRYHPRTILLGGGVSANEQLREALTNACAQKNITLKIPKIAYAMDNAAMIAAAAYHRAKKKMYDDWRTLVADPNWHLYDPTSQ